MADARHAIRDAAILLTFAATVPAAAQTVPLPAQSRATVDPSIGGATRLSPDYPMPYSGTTKASVKTVWTACSAISNARRRSGWSMRPGAKDEQLRCARTAGFASVQADQLRMGRHLRRALLAGKVTADPRNTRYAADRINVVTDLATQYRADGIDPQTCDGRGACRHDSGSPTSNQDCMVCTLQQSTA